MHPQEQWAYEPESEYTHVSEIEAVEQAKEFLADVVEGLYGDKPLDQIPNKKLTITKKNPYFQLGAALSRFQGEVLLRTTGE